jgi:heat shock protein HslJ
MRKLILLLAAVVALGPLAAFAQPAEPWPNDNRLPPSSAVLAPLVWRLTADGAAASLAPSAGATLQIHGDEQVAIQGDCVMGSGEAAVGSSTLRLNILATMNVACEQTASAAAYLAALAAVRQWRYDGPDLLLFAADGTALRFAPSLEGVVWQWQGTAMMNDTAFVPSDPAAFTLAFSANGALAIRGADCQWAGEFTVEDSRIDLMPGDAATLGPCGALADRFVRDLDEASSFVFDAGRLYLALPVDAELVAFAATDDGG